MKEKLEKRVCPYLEKVELSQRIPLCGHYCMGTCSYLLDRGIGWEHKTEDCYVLNNK